MSYKFYKNFTDWYGERYKVFVNMHGKRAYSNICKDGYSGKKSAITLRFEAEDPLRPPADGKVVILKNGDGSIANINITIAGGLYLMYYIPFRYIAKEKFLLSNTNKFRDELTHRIALRYLNNKDYNVMQERHPKLVSFLRGRNRDEQSEPLRKLMFDLIVEYMLNSKENLLLKDYLTLITMDDRVKECNKMFKDR